MRRKHRALTAKRRFGVFAACTLAACLPSAGLAVGALGGSSPSLAHGTMAQFTPAAVDPRIARLVAQSAKSNARLMRFTPAGVSDRSSRSMTVAVRVDGNASVITVRSAIGAAKDMAAAGAPSEVLIAPMRYNLGLARGYQSFAKAAAAAPAPTLSRTLSDAAIPDLATYKPAGAAKDGADRFAPRNPAAEPRAAAAPRTIEPQPVDQAVDLAGSYRLTHNLNVTAGVRYQSERDRLAPVADTAKKDNQAVYVGTQFRF
jgi:hypothetical protein